MRRRIILDLCGGTGSWSLPYREAGYDVRLITLPEYDVRSYDPPNKVYGILAAPPCTHFSSSGAQYWKEKDRDGRTIEDLQVVTSCLMIIARCQPKFWVIENPIGRMKDFLGKPDSYFQPYEFGDPYTKKTCLWGKFQWPKQCLVRPMRVCKQGSWLQRLGGNAEKTRMLRSITPVGFARAFFEANR